MSGHYYPGQLPMSTDRQRLDGIERRLAVLESLGYVNRVGQQPFWQHYVQHVPAPQWQPTHQHRKGALYRVVTRGKLEADLSDCVVYDDADGHVWVRPASEFDDGRFTPLPAPPGREAA
jgi:hypothetical protein